MDTRRIVIEWNKKSNSLSSEYSAYEEYFRGGEETTNRRLEEFDALTAWILNTLNLENPTWLDIASGSGLILESLNKRKIDCYGIESDSKLASFATKQGHSVFHGDANSILDFIAENGINFDVISCLHLIEHMDTETADKLIKKIYRILRPSGILVIATPNSTDMRVMLGSFYRDPTHIRPYPKELISYLYKKNNIIPICSTDFDRFPNDKHFKTNDENNNIKKKEIELLLKKHFSESGDSSTSHALHENIQKIMSDVSTIKKSFAVLTSGKNTIVIGSKPPLP